MESLLKETRRKLSSLPPRPPADAVEKAHRTVAAVDKKLASKMESLLLTEVPADVDKQQFHEIQEKKRAAAVAEANADKKKSLAIIELEEQYTHYEDIIRRGEAALFHGDAEAEKALILKQEVALKLVEDIKQVISREATEVDWSARDLESLPEIFGKMVSVRILNVSRNMLEVLPDSLAGLVNLEILDISGNRLSRLPDSIGALVKLRELNAARNKLLELPESICNCKDLEILTLTFNNLEELPDELGLSLSKLKCLYLGLNKIKHLPPTVDQLTELTHLDVHFNQLCEVPITIDNLHKLQVLDVSDNFSDLTSIPESIGNMVSLIELNLSNNQIHYVPLEIGTLPSLKKLEIDGNPWKNPPLAELKDKDQESLIQFLRQRSISVSSVPVNESPLLTFSKWLRDILAGKFDVGAWINSVVHGTQFPHLLGLPSSSRGPSSTELRQLDSKKEEDLEGGGSSSQMKV